MNKRTGYAMPRKTFRMGSSRDFFRLICYLLGVWCIGLLSACDSQESEESTLVRIQREKTVRIGFANEAPFAYLDEKSGQLTGEAPEIARRIFKRLGVDEVEGVLTEFGALIPGLKAERFDIIAAGMFITPQRCLEIAFTNPTYRISEAILVKSGNPLALHSYQDVAAQPKAILGIVAGTVQLGYARASQIPQQRIAILPDAPSAVEAVRGGRIDAYAGTTLTIQDLLNKAGKLAVERAEPFTPPLIDGRSATGYGAFGVRRQDHDLLLALNRELAAFIGSQEHLDTVAPFGFGALNVPGDINAAQLCASTP